MTSSGPPEWIGALRSDFELNQLVQALSLSERFHVYVLVCVSPRVADVALAIVTEMVEAERERPVELVRLNPYRDHRDMTAAIPYETLIQEVLEPLISPGERPSSTIFVVDASRALARDDDAWGLLLQRMNERRNVISAKLGRPLVFCMPPRMEPIFAQAAPDFWSIRSLAVEVRAAPLVLRREAMVAVEANEPRGDPEIGEVNEEGEVALARAVDDARRALTEAPRDLTRGHALAIRLRRLASYALDRNSLETARGAAEGQLKARQSLAGLDKNKQERQKDISRALRLAGNVYLARGDLEWATAMHEEGVKTANELVKCEPRQVEWLRYLRWALRDAAETRRMRDDFTGAEEAYNASESVAQQLIEADRAGYWAVESHLSLAGILCERGGLRMLHLKLTDARSDYEHALGLYQTVENRYGQAFVLKARGMLCALRGDLDGAAEDYKHALTLFQAIKDRRGQAGALLRRGELHTSYSLANALAALAKVHVRQGNTEAAEQTASEALALALRSENQYAERVARSALQELATHDGKR